MDRDDYPSGNVSWECDQADAGAHHVPLRVYRPSPAPYGWLVWAHGGSWHGGSLEHWHGPAMDLAAVSGCTVVSTGYRLAPRHRHPDQLHDVLAALAWAGRQAGGEPVAIGGDSAGGTIAACAALALRDGDTPLAAQVLAYPPLDPGCAAPSYTSLPGAFPAAADLKAAWRAYRGDTGEAAAGNGERLHSTPLEADRFDGLAPAILAVGDLDPVIDDVTGYARRLRQAGNDVTLRIFPRTPHAAFLSPFPGAGKRDPSLRSWLGMTLREQLNRQKETA
jgi:acetyl esterase